MDTEIEVNNKDEIKKRDLVDTEESINVNTKKARLFSVKEFRKRLNQGEISAALKEFLSVINETKKHDYVLEYLECGGNCLQLLQTLELDSAISPVLVFDLVTRILLKINANCPQYYGSAYEACRYIINSYVTILNKMINLSSSSQERKVCLKLLTAMITFSSTLAKDILLHVNFHSTNVELLTKSTGEKESVRDHFIHFLTAFLVDGQYPALSVLLEKKGFITSIISGLQFDDANTVCIVIAAMKNHILENPSVSKTAKMKTFNTIVVRDIVNLYNWKGPESLKAQKKGKHFTVTVDEYAKSKVSECAHDFLLVLCTSHKHGVIFKDPLLGIGKKNQNALMYTVLESLERPWEHSYACELVTKICGACPDLTKTMWKNLKPFLEPRLTEKWLHAIKFAKILLKELHPSCIEFCAKDLSVYQLSQITQMLIAPLPILRTIIPDNNVYEKPAIKYQVSSLLLDILQSLSQYIIASKNWLTLENHRKFKSLLSNYITRNFLNAQVILSEWECEDYGDIDETLIITQSQYFEIVFDILGLYENLAPQLFDSLSSINLKLSDFFTKLHEVCSDKETLAKLQIKIINIFIDFDQSTFSIKTELFSFVIPLMLKFYYETNSADALKVLRKLFKNTGIFDGCFHEINIWINAILDLKIFEEHVADGLVNVLKITGENAMLFLEQLSKIKSEKGALGNYSEIIENLANDNVSIENKTVIIKQRYLSPMILGLMQYLEEVELTKSFKIYANFVLLNLFHCQTQHEMLKEFIHTYDKLPSNISAYFLDWVDNYTISFVKKSKGKFDIFQTFSESILTQNIDAFLVNTDLSLYSDLPLNLLQASIFYLSSLVSSGTLTSHIAENCEKFVKNLIDKNILNEFYIETILGHQVLLGSLSFLDLEKETSKTFATKFLLAVIKVLQNSGHNIEGYLKVYREKLLSAILKLLKKPKKYKSSLDYVGILELFNLSYAQCVKVLAILSDLLPNVNEHYPIILDILCYCLEQISNLCQVDMNLEPLSECNVKQLTTYFVIINKKQDVNVSKLSVAFQKYFETFPHDLKSVNKDLFPSILNLTEYAKENVSLAVFLLERNIQYLDDIKENIETICDKKGVALPLFKVLVDKSVDNSILEQMFNKFQPSLTKALQKPQKAGQHFHQNYEAVVALIQACMPLEKCQNFVNKVHKFEVSEVFHATLIAAIARKVIDTSISAKQINNIIMIFVHLQVNIFKRKTRSEDDVVKVNNIAGLFNNILSTIYPKIADKDLKNTSGNETVKLYFKSCLKFGVSGQPVLLQSLRNLVKVLASDIDKEDAKLILDMLLSHSEFLDKVLGEHDEVKLEILSLFLMLCQNWNEFMDRSHIPVLLAAYRARVNKCDRRILALLKMYEGNVGQTNFYDFKPYLWGRTAANHYSVRQNMANSLWRQPKMGDVLDILQEDIVASTIVSYPLGDHLQVIDGEVPDSREEKSYDLKFLLPLFSQLLAPEQQVQTYKFTRSGALSLTVVGLSSQDKEVRQAACHVLSRFHYHVDASQRGKDNLLWIRYVEAVCKGTALLPDFKLNNFSAIYLAQMALILTQPNHVMYVPLSQHLTAKSSLDFSTVPELYTFLHSPDISYREHRNFTLELLKAGLRTEKDFMDFLRSMGYKLFSELYSSCLADLDTRVLILGVIGAICRIPVGVKMICENHSFLSQIFTVVSNILLLSGREKQDSQVLIRKIVCILLDVCKTLDDVQSNFMILNIIMGIIRDDAFNFIGVDTMKIIFEILNLIFVRYDFLFSEYDVGALLDKSKDKFCKYISVYGCHFVNVNSLDINDKYYHLRLLFVNRMKNK